MRPLFLFLMGSVLSLTAPVASRGQWRQIGPYGGDVRSLAADPADFNRIFLGTSSGQVYASADGGHTWRWLSAVAERSDYVLDVLIVDAGNSSILYAAAWSMAADGGGGVFKSTDGGRTWRSLPGMAGRSVRALAQWPKDPRVLVAGALEGVFRTANAGQSWERISPANHQEIRNIESVAIDPTRAGVVYAGTWHLPWKTEDGGQSWHSIKAGIIDDSDIFSIVIDWNNPRTVYVSACSGIYRTDSAGAVWRKIQGIPHTARRTRVILQDPVNPGVVYAGTTEGLWKTESGGASWRRTTSAKLIINDILVDPRHPSRVLLGTDRAGVLESSDGGENFQASNSGFAHRRVSRAAYDPVSSRIYAAVLHDKEYGGVFAGDGGRAWRQLSSGLDDRDVFALIYARTPQDGRLLAGMAGGLMAYDPEKNQWTRVGRLARGAPGPALPQPRVVPPRAGRGRPKAAPPVAPRPAPSLSESGFLKAAVNDFFQAGPDQPLYAATSEGVLRSDDGGLTWHALGVRFHATAIAAQGKMLVAGTATGLDLSFNGGAYFFHIYLPGTEPAHANALAVSGKTIFVATDIGLFRSTDSGASWEKKGRGVPYGPVSGVRIHPADPQVVYVTTRTTGVVYRSADGGKTFQEMERDGLVGARLGPLEILPQNGSQAYALLIASALDGLFLRELGAGAVGDGNGNQ